VVAVGPEAKGAAVGDRRVVFPWIGCGECAPCKSGHEELCLAPRALGVNRDGGFADHVLVPHPRYLFAYDPLSEAQACTYACSGLTAYAALRKCAPLGTSDTLLVIGAGGVGLSAVRMALAALGVVPGGRRDRPGQMGHRARRRRRRLPRPDRRRGDEGVHEGARRRRRGDRFRRRRRHLLVGPGRAEEGRQAGLGRACSAAPRR
jgi:hypothetical protein